MRLCNWIISGCCTLAFSAHAALFSPGPIKLVHGVPGGLVDNAARVLAERLSVRWGQPVIVDGKPGAVEGIAAVAVAKAGDDGHTLLLASEAVLINAPLLYRKPMVDPNRDLVPVGELFEIPFALVVRGDFPANNLREFIALMRRDGKRRVYASSGPGSPLHLAMESLRRHGGFEMTQVPYTTISQLTQDLLGGLVDATFISVPFAAPFVQSGKLKVLAVTGGARSSASPATPTFAESGFPQVDYQTTVVMMAPRSTAPETIRRIETDVRAVVHSEEFMTRFLTPSGLRPGAVDARELKGMLEARRFSTMQLIRQLDIAPE